MALEDLQHLCQANARPGRQRVFAVGRDLSESRAAIERKRVESIPDYMRLYLIDAIYFKGDGTAQFDANLTQPRPQQ
jgi:hypothetical protein